MTSAGRLTEEITPDGTLEYEYDRLGNLTTLTLPDSRKVNHLYYGSGHLHQLNLDGQVISDMERDDLYREVYRTQGKAHQLLRPPPRKLNSQFEKHTTLHHPFTQLLPDACDPTQNRRQQWP